MIKNCCICGKEINVTNRQKYCSDCRKEHRKKYVASYCKINKEHISVDAGDYALLVKYARKNKLTLNKAFHKIVVDNLEKA